MTTLSPSTTVSLYFDPGCPWTWLTARWLQCVAGERDLTIEWRSLSLSVLSGSDVEKVPAQWRGGAELSRDALRLIEALRAADRTDQVEALYVGLGERLFTDGMTASREVLIGAADEAGVSDLLAVADDPVWDAAVERSTREGVALGGPDLGSPVLVVDGRALFGPIISSVPGREDSVKLWDSLLALNAMDSFFELKRERDAGPDLASADTGMVCAIAP